MLQIIIRSVKSLKIGIDFQNSDLSRSPYLDEEILGFCWITFCPAVSRHNAVESNGF